MIPCPGLDLDLDSFLGGNSHTKSLYPKIENLPDVALVIPIYEITTDVNVEMPRNKTDLVEYIGVSETAEIELAAVTAAT